MDITRPSWWGVPFSVEEREVYERYRRPGRAPFELSTAALLIVDVTEAFLGPRLPTAEAVAVLRTACGLPGWEAVEVIRRLLDSFRQHGRRVIFARPDWAGEAVSGGTTVGGAQATPRLDHMPELLTPESGEAVILKAKASAFFGTPLITQLVRAGVSSIVLVGSTTSGCVRATAIDASSYGFNVAIPWDGCFDRAATSHAAALYELDVKYATVVAAGDLIGRD